MRIEELHPYLLIMSQLCYCYINPHYSLNEPFNSQNFPFPNFSFLCSAIEKKRAIRVNASSFRIETVTYTSVPGQHSFVYFAFSGHLREVSP